MAHRSFQPDPNIQRPDPILIDDCKRRWASEKRYVVQEESIRLLFHDKFPKHDNLAEVLIKVTVLNDFYSTVIYSPLAVALRIVEVNPAARIASGDLSLVNEMKAVKIKENTINFYSFTSKYCCQHNPEAFPIYDKRVKEMLMYFQKLDRFDKFTEGDLQDYFRFVDVMKSFRRRYRLDQVPWRWIDRYLWFTGTDVKNRKARKRRSKGLNPKEEPQIDPPI